MNPAEECKIYPALGTSGGAPGSPRGPFKCILCMYVHRHTPSEPRNPSRTALGNAGVCVVITWSGLFNRSLAWAPNKYVVVGCSEREASFSGMPCRSELRLGVDNAP